jgi:hypothetical protein
MTAGAALEWMLADWISRRGIARGPLVLFAVIAATATISQLAAFGAQAGREGVASAHSIIPLLSGLPLALVSFALSRQGVIEWPAAVKRGLVLTSPIDLLIVPYAVGRLALELISRTPPFPWLVHLDTLVAIAAAAGITVWLLGRPARGVIAGYIGAALIAPFFGLAPTALVLALDEEASLARFVGRGRGYEGTARFEVLLTAEGGDGFRDAPIIVERARALGIHGEVLDAASGRIRLRLTGSERLGEVLGRVLVGELPASRAMSREWSLASITAAEDD